MLSYFAFRAIPAAEEVADGCYRRTIRHGGEVGVLQVSCGDGHLRAEFWLPLRAVHEKAMDLESVTERLRDMFGLEAELVAVAAHLASDPVMAVMVARHPQLRIPGGWDPFEVAIRTVLGQQVSVAAARLLAARLIARCGEDVPASPFMALKRVFPTAAAVTDADLSNMGMPGARAATLKAVAAAFIETPSLFQKGASAEATVAGLRQIKGIGEWSAQYIAMRACREADAFPAGDAGILRALVDENGRPKPTDLLVRAEQWRPYRAFAAHYIWAHGEAQDSVEVQSVSSKAPW